MNKKLAIKGHPTRGKEVIELLEMMGGKNNCDCPGDNLGLCYLIDDEFDICAHYFGYDDYEDGELTIFTLEEFLEKYPFKVGDKVYIKVDPNENCLGYDKIYGEIESAMWVEKFGYVVYKLKDSGGIFYREDLHACKEEESMEDNKLFGTLSNPIETKSYAVCLKDGEVIDNLEKTSVKNHKMGPKSKLPSKYYEEIQTKRDIDKAEFVIKHMILPNKMDDKLEYEIIDGYEFDKVENGKIILKPIKSKYPTNYQECCDVLGLPMQNALKYINKDCNKHDYYNDLQSTLNCFVSLKMCRDAYWKIAGEGLGLDKPWKPDWDNLSTNHEFIKINKGCFIYSSRVLVFPTEEMRDAFYENFKELIESCKELL